MPDDDTSTPNNDSTPTSDSAQDPTRTPATDAIPATDAGQGAADVPAAPAKTARRRTRSQSARAAEPSLDVQGSALQDSDPQNSGDHAAHDGTDAPAPVLDAAAAPASPRKRAPRKSASRRRAVAAEVDQPATDGVLDLGAEPAAPPSADAPDPVAASSPAAPAAAAAEALPAAETEPAPPRARSARASSGFALLARAAPVFSHSPTAPPVVPGARPEAADAPVVTPESLLAALDAVAPPTGGRPPAAAPAPVAAVPVFVPPMPVFVDPADYWGTTAAADDDTADDETDDDDTDDDTADDETAEDGPQAARDDEPAGEGAAPEDESEDSAGAAAGARRRRRRGGRRRRGSADRPDEDTADGTARAGGSTGTSKAAASGDDRTDESSAGTDGPDGSSGAEREASAASDVVHGDEDESPDGDGADGSEDGATGSRRRRRRRRRGAEDGDTPTADDPPDTVVRVREPRRSRARREDGDSEITAARGSTRIEAKKQRRRDGREARKRPPILSEAEFLARRESVARSMLVRDSDGRTQIAVLEDGMLVEHYIAEDATPTDRSLIGDVYLGRVQNVLPAMEAAFIDIGRGRNAVLYAGEVDWDGLGMEGKPKRIELALKSGQSVLVQVTKDPIGQKGARLTAQVSLAGRYLVLVPNGSMSGISRKLPDAERARLKKILRELLPAKAGVIVRTAAEGATEEELAADVARLTGQWDEISAQAATASAPALLQGEPNLATKVVRDIFNEDFTSLVVSGDKVLAQIRSYIGSVAPNLLDRVSAWTAEQDLFAANRVDEQLVKALDRKVFLPSGGSLVIDRTEAMTVVDVNTGRFTGSGGNLEETVTENNLEAAEELVRQLRLRDIGGIIVVDFIDMVFEANRDLVVRRLVECLGRDRTRHQVAEVSSLGLVQMTRKRIGRGLLEVFGRPCETCRGRGMVVDLNGHGIADHEPVASGAGAPPRIPNPGNTGRAHLRTIVSAIPVGDLAAADPADPAEPDLSEPDLSEADLSEADLSEPDLSDAEQLEESDVEQLEESAEVLTNSEALEILADAEPELETVILLTDAELDADPVPEQPGGDADDASPVDGSGSEPVDFTVVTTDPDDGVDRDLAVVVTGSAGSDDIAALEEN